MSKESNQVVQKEVEKVEINLRTASAITEYLLSRPMGEVMLLFGAFDSEVRASIESQNSPVKIVEREAQ